MSTHQPPNPWQTSSRSISVNNTRPTSRTPGAASPSGSGYQTPTRGSGPSNAWAGRNSGVASAQDEQHTPVNGFNVKEVEEFLSRARNSGELVAGGAYKPTAGDGGRTTGPWGVKANHMANNQPFFVQLAKQIAALEGGG